jgi:hypothetical protein
MPSEILKSQDVLGAGSGIRSAKKVQFLGDSEDQKKFKPSNSGTKDLYLTQSSTFDEYSNKKHMPFNYIFGKG